MSVLVWIIAGIIAGWLTGMIVRGAGYGLLGDLVIGLIGGLIGGALAGAFGIQPTNLLGGILIAALGSPCAPEQGRGSAARARLDPAPHPSGHDLERLREPHRIPPLRSPTLRSHVGTRHGDAYGAGGTVRLAP